MWKQNRDLAAGFAAAFAALLLFGWLADQVLRHQTIQFDATVRNGLHAFATPLLTNTFLGFTWLGTNFVLIPLAVLVVLLLRRHGRSHAAVLFIVAVVGGEILDETLKLIIHRPRPVTFFGYPVPPTYSFPSGHAMISAVFCGVMAAILTARMRSPGKRAAVWAGAAVIALLIGISRIYLGVHYPSDVVAGYAAAVIWVAAVRAGYRVWLRRVSPRRDS